MMANKSHNLETRSPEYVFRSKMLQNELKKIVNNDFLFTYTDPEKGMRKCYDLIGDNLQIVQKFNKTQKGTKIPISRTVIFGC